uniref:Uncharacterized protein n=1 Tax=Euplotes crassus TaxID=5936 RepID=A0A7S3KP86_EUPCR|mmetsp:Transcript_34647/g.34271  ORF Transcript_34647/g.34271 Transcript_34647/m.34271 type:complete len:213 (+) Transcript_34647:731-1369(+)|eukprot:CAMPEP_0196999418 /NCGR_PEP_ID=MMETSP1380-20130617/4603_1 /TAXON_ID=5936 /ORGANISM="Euplotes crassus, Strain CT5" /LENGTH=212 /DNA_ID=CAMNT_0042416339 /DNA_START=723 /DNA_END=1361 /DNA_ORIENTATION=+
MKKSKSMACNVKEDSLNLGIKRNSKVKYVKADVFRKHEKIRDQLFEEKISELVHRTENRQEEKTTSFFNDGNFNFQHTPIDDPCEVGGLVEDSGEVTPHDNNEFVIAQDYGSFDDGENLDSQYSSMLGESISGEFNLEVVGSKIDLPKVDTLANIDEDASKPSGPCQLGSKITFGEPSGEVFGLTFDNNCNGIFCNDGNNEFLPINTLQTDN